MYQVDEALQQETRPSESGLPASDRRCRNFFRDLALKTQRLFAPFCRAAVPWSPPCTLRLAALQLSPEEFFSRGPAPAPQLQCQPPQHAGITVDDINPA